MTTDNKKTVGRVSLVGAGPGDPGLLTLRAARLLAEADVVVYDHLIAGEVLSHVREGAALRYAGKEGGRHTLSQDEINRLLVEEARAGKSVVRLKGGDPFVFGRGGEEALELARAGIPFEVVPGVSSGSAVPAYAGIPVTHQTGRIGRLAVAWPIRRDDRRPHGGKADKRKRRCPDCRG
jgi:uroporphyrin-III C-methyltransferase